MSLRNLVPCLLCVAMVHGHPAGLIPAWGQPAGEHSPNEQAMLAQLDAPLLFVKRHSYSGIHIYDTFYKWPPGGGGIYVIENPSAPRDQWKVRAVIDETTPETLGHGVYSDPELSWDGRRLLFCFKGEPNGNTSIFEIGVDGTALRRLTDPAPSCAAYRGRLGGQHDVNPAYLPDGRIVFLSTRPSGLVPCNNTGVAILHVMNADGTDIHPISVNNVNEFDPCPLPDGRILFGRWEYVDKNALTIQSLWAVNPDGTQENAFYANNMVFPEAILDARPVPDSNLIVGTFAKHNSTPRGTIAMVDPQRGKNGPQAIVNFEHPENPTVDTGDSCEPWPLSEELVLFSGRPAGSPRNVIELMDRVGNRLVVHSDPDICLHSPMLVKARPRPPRLPDTVDRGARTGRFFVQDIYQGLIGVKRGEVKWLRVLEETSRTSEGTDGPNPYNQTFLLSSALAFSVKSFLGIVPVREDGSAYFEVPVGRAVYFQALDADGRLVQSMRTFIQAAPGTTRSCIGCHEPKSSAARAGETISALLGRKPQPLEPESWGSGYLDYPSMVQPILDRHCVRCHGGTEGIAGGMDLSGGWTEHFNISYENLTNRCETQLMAYWIDGIDCMNGTALWSSRIFLPRSHGSATAPLAELLVNGHEGQISDLTRRERDLLMAWIDTNGLYHGTWNRTPSGCAIRGWTAMKGALTGAMREAGCLACHGKSGQLVYFENDWVNLQTPEHSRILRAPLARSENGLGLAWCRQRKVTADRQRIHLLWNGYAHAVQPPEAFATHERVRPDRRGEAVVSFASTEDPHYQTMLRIVREAREAALAEPRVDMPHAHVIPGACRLFHPPAVPRRPLSLSSEVDPAGAVRLAWEQSAATIGMTFELHRSSRPGFSPTADTRLVETPLFGYVDWAAPTGMQYYALVPVVDGQRGTPSRLDVSVPPPQPPAAPEQLRIVPASGVVRLRWHAPRQPLAGFLVYRADAGSDRYRKLTPEPLRQCHYSDLTAEPEKPFRYHVRSVSYRQIESEPSRTVEGVSRVIREPVFEALDTDSLEARLYGGATVAGKRHGGAMLSEGTLSLAKPGYVTFPHQAQFDLGQPLTIACDVFLEEPGAMPVVVSCGVWKQAGWFLQRFGGGWRWHVGGIDCDGGEAKTGHWIHLVASFDGQRARLFENGKLVAEQAGPFNTAPWGGALHVGQYSGQPAAPYQVTGRIRNLKIFHRPLGQDEIAED